MTTAAAAPTLSTGTAVLVAVVQFLFVGTWTIYVVYLPQLLQAAGLPAAWAPRLLIVDQIVFMACDIAAGLAADRALRTVGRLGGLVAMVTAVSCVAFLLLPHATGLGAAAGPLLLGLMLVWVVTSSALRAPPWALLGRHAARPALPWLNAITLVGVAASGALAPYLGVVLKQFDPRLPFATSSLALMAVTATLVLVDRRLAAGRGAGAVPATPSGAAATATPTLPSGAFLGWLLGTLMLGAAFQIHFSLNAAPQYLRHAAAAQLEWLMPLFWVGFAAGALPAGALCARVGALGVAAGGAVIGAVAALVGSWSPSLEVTVAAQIIAGASWGAMLPALYTSAAEHGRTGREGLALGAMCAMLALATLVRIAAALAGWPKDPDIARWLAWGPAILWGLGAWLLTVLALGAATREPPRPLNAPSA
ncbi:MAG: hypothetical protein JNN18_04990 [Rubrivivax sp.]|nr:hypothetical protein [Rubrivivax sp.]